MDPEVHHSASKPMLVILASETKRMNRELYSLLVLKMVLAVCPPPVPLVTKIRSSVEHDGVVHLQTSSVSQTGCVLNFVI